MLAPDYDPYSPPSDVRPARVARVMMADIIRVTASVYGIARADLLGRSQERRCSIPRQVAMYLSYDLAKKSQIAIGKAFSRDHTTATHAIHKIRAEVQTNAGLAAKVAAIRDALSSSNGFSLIQPETRAFTCPCPPGSGRNDLAGAVLTTPAGPGRPLSEQGA